MFATLLGSLPRPSLPDDATPEALLDAVLELQVEHGLEPLIDGGWALDGDPVAAWRGTTARTDRLVKAAVRDRSRAAGPPRISGAWSVTWPMPGAAGSKSTSRLRRDRNDPTREPGSATRTWP